MIIKYKDLKSKDKERIVQIIKQAGTVVLPTDTIYGIHASIFLPRAIKRVYKLKGREEKNPFIILINKIEDIESLGINISDNIKIFLKKIWPGKVSVVFNESLAFRMPKNKFLRNIISKTGPIISTSVNTSGKNPARNINDAYRYFGDKIDLYIDAGKRDSAPSTLIEIKNGKIEILRQGSIKNLGFVIK